MVGDRIQNEARTDLDWGSLPSDDSRVSLRAWASAAHDAALYFC